MLSGVFGITLNKRSETKVMEDGCQIYRACDASFYWKNYTSLAKKFEGNKYFLHFHSKFASQKQLADNIRISWAIVKGLKNLFQAVC